VRVHLAAEHALEFQPPNASFECVGVALDIARRGLVVLAFGEIEQFGRIADSGMRAVEFLELRR
jgi:hypothetical protein